MFFHSSECITLLISVPLLFWKGFKGMPTDAHSREFRSKRGFQSFSSVGRRHSFVDACVCCYLLLLPLFSHPNNLSCKYITLYNYFCSRNTSCVVCLRRCNKRRLEGTADSVGAPPGGLQQYCVVRRFAALGRWKPWSRQCTRLAGWSLHLNLNVEK